jgi:hypothetical protein
MTTSTNILRREVHAMGFSTDLKGIFLKKSEEIWVE